MKIHVVIVNLVNRAPKKCFKAALGLIFLLSKTDALSLFLTICVQSVFIHLQLDVCLFFPPGMRVVRVSFS